MVKSIRRVFKKDRPAEELQPGSMKRRSKAKCKKKPGILLLEFCIKHASDFVKEERGKGDSPFREIPILRFFHEMMMINFWIVDKTLSQGGEILMSEVYSKYLEHFISPEKDFEDAVSVRFRAYNNTWNDHTGHHDEFGIKASQNIFGRGTNIPFPQTSFWIITYADRTMKTFKKLCKAGEIKI